MTTERAQEFQRNLEHDIVQPLAYRRYLMRLYLLFLKKLAVSLLHETGYLNMI